MIYLHKKLKIKKTHIISKPIHSSFRKKKFRLKINFNVKYRLPTFFQSFNEIIIYI